MYSGLFFQILQSIRSPIIHLSLYHTLHRIGDGGEKVIARLALNAVHRHTVVSPTDAANALFIGHVHCDYSCLGCYTADIVHAFGQDDNHFPSPVRHGDFSISNSGGGAYRTRASLSVATCYDVEFVALLGECAAVVLQYFPRSLIVVGGLRDDVGEVESGFVVFIGGGAVGRGAEVSSIKSAVGVVPAFHSIPARRQRSVGVEAACPVCRAEPEGA